MESLASGTLAGAGSFRCKRCGYVLTLTSLDTLGDCPGCGGRSFARASLFSAARHHAGEDGGGIGGGYGRASYGAANADTVPSLTGRLPRSGPADRDERVAQAMEMVQSPGEYLVFEEDGEGRTVALTREWTRIGRSLAADVRFDDPTVSRRHALVVRQADGVRVLDDRSLNGVFVNGERIEWRALHHGDEILVGRYRMTFVSLAAEAEEADRPAADTAAA
jgi:predicted  nucleic acid-binding Zn-ribbon protein